MPYRGSIFTTTMSFPLPKEFDHLPGVSWKSPISTWNTFAGVSLKVTPLGRGFCWLDTGTHESLQQASSYVQAVQDRQGLKVACIEEIAYQLGYITIDQLARLASGMLKNQYGRYIMDIVAELSN